ncbi:MAG: ArsR/SmtB family transcription factor [Thermoplasmata archaeon]
MTDILDLIDNEIRRKILSILSIRPSYIFELAKTLGTSQQLISKHLKILEDSGLVYKIGKFDSEEGPQRILYKANAPLLSLLQFIEKISLMNFDNEDEVDERDVDIDKLISDLKSIDSEILVLESKIKELIIRQQSILLKINEILNEMDTSSLFNLMDDALKRGNFEIILDALNKVL